MQKILCPLLLVFLGTNSLIAQTLIEKPFAAELSHPELAIDRITLFTDSTVIDFTVENKADRGGWFCADQNIYIEIPQTLQRFYRRASRGIPTCPAAHNFSRKGETLSFSLIFPAIPSGQITVNLIEECDKACFYFKGLILSNKLNNDIRMFNQGMGYYTGNETAKAIECFSRVVDDIPSNPTHVYGYAYYHLVMIYHSRGDNLTAAFWLNQLKSSMLPNRGYFIRMIKRDTGLE